MTQEPDHPIGVEMNGEGGLLLNPDVTVHQGVGVRMNGPGATMMGGRIEVGAPAPAPDWITAPRPSAEASPGFWTRAGTAFTGAVAYGVTKAVMDSSGAPPKG